MVVMFVDLKAAFDTTDKAILLEIMEKSGIREGLIRRIEEVLRKTRCRMKVQREVEGKVLDSEGGEAGVPVKPPAI